MLLNAGSGVSTCRAVRYFSQNAFSELNALSTSSGLRKRSISGWATAKLSFWPSWVIMRLLSFGLSVPKRCMSAAMLSPLWISLLPSSSAFRAHGAAHVPYSLSPKNTRLSVSNDEAATLEVK